MDDDFQFQADFVRASLGARESGLAALAILLYSLHVEERVLLKERSGDQLVMELQCIAAIRDELLLALRSALGAGPWDEFDPVKVFDWMIGDDVEKCRTSVRRVIRDASRDMARSLDD